MTSQRCLRETFASSQGSLTPNLYCQYKRTKITLQLFSKRPLLPLLNMSAAKNSAAAANQGEFRSRVPGSEPLTTKGVSRSHMIEPPHAHVLQHKPGVLAAESDRTPEFSAQSVPAGSAPASSTYQPNPDLNNQRMYQDASTTLQGATSGDVHTGLGHPGQGQTSSELHDNRTKGTGLVGRSSQTERSAQNEKTSGSDPAFAHQRNLDDVPTGQRGNVGGPPAEEREPETADRVAAETK